MPKWRLTIANKIIWDRRAPSMGDSTYKFSSVHDDIGFLITSRDYHFDVDAVCIPYNAEMKKVHGYERFEDKK